MFTYTGQGSLALGGCSTYYLIIKVPYKYVPGNVTYYKPKAEQGKLEKIVVKKNKETHDVFEKVYFFDY